MGNGPLSAMRSLGTDVTRVGPVLRDFATAGVPVVAVGGGFDLATNQVVPTDGAPIDGFGVFDARAVRGAERRVNYLVLESRYPLLPGASTRLAGFEDHAARIELADGVSPFADVVSGGGQPGRFAGRGCRHRQLVRHAHAGADPAAQPAADRRRARRGDGPTRPRLHAGPGSDGDDRRVRT
ncbi:hypothetical protein [Curtobacterium sp. MCPF17_052]|uniref:hypothetical protein n=1 Tax=Curtobacterium sp. MCPF17_052 TaxID=2175655 RepID=UPI0024DF482E|nr:hypothetical protein [Curtobacterium sp. MCPF17_052]WIB12531.1 hypothetical protein DEJ36_18250 [Curtobacterium sp. MCPF17_052]